MCEQLRKGKIDICCLQEARWREQGARFVGDKGKRYKLKWSRNYDSIRGVGILVKDELCVKVVEVQRKSDRVMAMVLVFEEEVIRDKSHTCVCSSGGKIKLREGSIL